MSEGIWAYRLAKRRRGPNVQQKSSSEQNIITGRNVTTRSAEAQRKGLARSIPAAGPASTGANASSRGADGGVSSRSFAAEPTIVILPTEAVSSAGASNVTMAGASPRADRADSLGGCERILTAAPRRAGVDAGERQHSELVANLRRRLAADIGDDDVERYFDGQTRVHLRQDRLEVTVASGLLAKLLDSRYGASLRRAAAGAMNQEVAPEVSFKVDRQAFVTSPAANLAQTTRTVVGTSPSQLEACVQGAGTVARSNGSSTQGPSRSGGQRGHNSRFTFETFLVGKSNRIAHGAVVRMAEQPGYIAPIFLHGSCGMGKTHLLQATVHRFLQVRPTGRVRYTTAEAFTNEFVTAIKGNRVDAFRKAYRRVDLLAIDDAHFFSSKEATQAELLHTLDEVGQEGARIVIASDEHPREIQKLSERLSSRFLAGVVIRVDPPDRELRERLVVHLAQRRHITINEPAVRLLVDRTERSIGSLGGFGGSVRELEGLLNQIDAVHRLLPELAGQDGEVGALLVRKALGLNEEPAQPLGNGRVRRPIAGEVILAETCRALEVEVHDVMDRGRHQRVVLARALIAYLCRTLTALSFPEIAGIMGRANHSTVITAFKRFQRQMADGQVPVVAMPAMFLGMTLREISEAITRVIAKASS